MPTKKSEPKPKHRLIAAVKTDTGDLRRMPARLVLYVKEMEKKLYKIEENNDLEDLEQELEEADTEYNDLLAQNELIHRIDQHPLSFRNEFKTKEVFTKSIEIFDRKHDINILIADAQAQQEKKQASSSRVPAVAVHHAPSTSQTSSSRASAVVMHHSPSTPQKTPWWKYGLAILGIAIGLAACGTGIGAFAGAVMMAASGAYLATILGAAAAIGGAAYVYRSAETDKKLQNTPATRTASSAEVKATPAVRAGQRSSTAVSAAGLDIDRSALAEPVAVVPPPATPRHATHGSSHPLAADLKSDNTPDYSVETVNSLP